MPRPRKQSDLEVTIASITARAAREIVEAVKHSLDKAVAGVLPGVRRAETTQPSQPPSGNGATPAAPKARKKRRLTPEGRKRLSELMKARWAARKGVPKRGRKAAG
jgi:hypothetical protein